jgi:hypothetical protein
MNGPTEKKDKDIAFKSLTLLHDAGLPTSL